MAGAARSTIQLSVDVATKAAATAIVAEGFRESVPLQQPTKAETTSYPLSNPLEGYDSWISAPTLPSQQVWADPLAMVEIGDNVVYSVWLGQNVQHSGIGDSGRTRGYAEATSDLPGGLLWAQEAFEALTGRIPQIGDLQSKQPTDSYIELGKIEVYFRPTSRSGTPVLEIIDHGNKTNEKIHFN